MAGPEGPRIGLPPGEAARQAIGALRGYVYQLNQSLQAWLTLPADEILLLEVAEDYAIVARAALEAIQVRATRASVTLRSSGVVDAIGAFWRLQEANPDKVVRLTYLTTSGIGHEQGLVFPDGMTGLAHWRAAARDGSDLSAIKRALGSLPLPAALVSWIEAAEPNELRERLLRRIRWACGADGPDSLGRAIMDRIVLLAPQMGFQPSDAVRVRDALLAAVLECVTGSGDRELTRADLLRGIEDATSLSMPLSAIRGIGVPVSRMQIAAAAGHAALISTESVPLPARATERGALVEELRGSLALHGALWLYGSSGVGKTILAQLVVSASTRPWFILQLRDCAGPDLDSRLAAAQEALASHRAGGIILDDLPMEQRLNARVRLSAVGEEARATDALVIVTCAKPPPPSVAECLGDGTPTVKAAPYLDELEVAAMVAAAGGDPTSWTRVIHAFCGRGHPQLVDARIGGLSRRDWPASELLEGVGAGPQPIEIEAQREAIRAKLLAELPDEASGLLYRLSMVAGAFDRQLALSLARVEPRARRSGEAFEILVGPWIEARGEGRYAISPLLDDIGELMLDDAERGDVLRAIVDDLMARDPFPGDFAGYFLIHALRTGREEALLRLSLMILPRAGQDEGDDLAMARATSVLASLDGYDDAPFLPGNPNVSFMLRHAQFRVAALARPRRLEPVARRLLIEAREFSLDTPGPPFLSASLTALLMEARYRVPSTVWMGWLEELRTHSDPDDGSPSFLADGDAPLPGTEGWTYIQHLFAARASNLSDARELRDTLDEVRRLGPARSAPYVEVLNGPNNIAGAVVQACWLEVQETTELDAVDAAEGFRLVQERAEAWRWRALAVECGCIRVAILDERVDDAVAADSAMEVLRLGYPGDRQVRRTHTNLLHRRGLHAACAASAHGLAEGLVAGEGIDMALAMRGGALSAAALGDAASAEELLQEAHRAMEPTSAAARAFAVGLLGDAARCAWDRGAPRRALHWLACAVIASDGIDPDAVPSARWCVKALSHLILHLHGGSFARTVSPDGQTLPYGFCSRPTPPVEIMGEPAPSTIALWYMLAALEGHWAEDLGIFTTLRHRTAGRRHGLYETVFAAEYLSRHVRRLDVPRFLAQLPEFASCAGYAVLRQGDSASPDVTVGERERIPALEAGDWHRDPFAGLIEEAVLAFALSAVAMGRPELLERLASGLPAREAGMLRPPTGVRHEKPPAEVDGPGAVAWAARRLAEPGALDPDALFLATACLWLWLGRSLFRHGLEGPLARRLARRWRESIAVQGFRLQAPQSSAPAIAVAAADDIRWGRATLAELLLTAEQGVRCRLPSSLRSSLRTCASGDGAP